MPIRIRHHILMRSVAYLKHMLKIKKFYFYSQHCQSSLLDFSRQSHWCHIFQFWTVYRNFLEKIIVLLHLQLNICDPDLTQDPDRQTPGCGSGSTTLFIRNILTINVPVVYMARYVIFWRRPRSITRGMGRGVPWKSILFWALKWLRAKRGPFWPKKDEISHTPIQPFSSEQFKNQQRRIRYIICASGT